MDKHIVVSFSGGRTSAYMAKMLIDQHGLENVTCVFANTGSEHEKTLDFVHECDKRWGLNVIWLEAKVNHEGRGRGFSTTYTVVDYESASRDNEPFEEVIKKFGLANTKYLHCTRELKERPITAWTRDNYAKGGYNLAIGIRSDEMDRQNLVAKVTRNITYPLIEMGKTISDVESYWESSSFDLGIPSYLGNCVTCHKKADRKLFTIAMEDPSYFDWIIYAEDKYSQIGSDQGGRKVYRKNRTARDIIFEANNTPFKPWEDLSKDDFIEQFEFDLDLGGGCGDSCEVFSDNSYTSK